MADAAICAWDAKYTFNFWRTGDRDCLRRTTTELDVLQVTPPFPDYTSGHSTFSAAAATVLPLFYGTEDLPFTTGSDFLPGVFRSFSTCFDAAEEAQRAEYTAGFTFERQAKMGCKRAAVSAKGPLPIICSPSTIARGTDGLLLTLDFSATGGCSRWER